MTMPAGGGESSEEDLSCYHAHARHRPPAAIGSSPRRQILVFCLAVGAVAASNATAPFASAARA